MADAAQMVPRLLDIPWMQQTYRDAHDGTDAADIVAMVTYFIARDGMWGYGKLCADLFADQKTTCYNDAVRQQIQQVSALDKILFMNFKSHNILDDSKAHRMFGIIKVVDADIVCLSEALVPNSIADSAGELHTIRHDVDSVIVQPHQGPNIAPCFLEKKRTEYANTGGQLASSFGWEVGLYDLGYRYIMFSNPTTCPWGSNWGNVMIFRSKPEACEVMNLQIACGKTGFGGVYDESRSAIVASVRGHVICSTHLEDKSEDIRNQQVQQLLEGALPLRPITNATLVGDINALDRSSYNDEQWTILRTAAFPPLQDSQDLPTAACTAITDAFGGLQPANRGQQLESLYQKCVCHAWSTRYENAKMLFTDVTSFDHQPLVLTAGER